MTRPLAPPGDLVELAPAKVNLTLRVLGRRPDGYHELDSLVAFADVGDRLRLAPGDGLDLSVEGPTAQVAGALADNLVLKAAGALADRIPGLRLGRFSLSKNLPVAAGLGGGSSDAAAALRLLARANALATDDPRLRDAAVATGADVPVCLAGRACMMRGIGEVLSEPLDLPPQSAVLVNPRVGVATGDVFKALNAPELPHAPTPQPVPELGAIDAFIRREPNDLETPAVTLQPVIADVLAAFRNLADCRLARMSGSGATCFGLFASPRAAAAAARALRAAQPSWWVRPTVLR